MPDAMYKDGDDPVELAYGNADLPSNSYAQREKESEDKPDKVDPKDLTKYTPKPAKIVKKKEKKKTFGQKLRESLFGDVENIPDYLFFDIFVPACKRLFFGYVADEAREKLGGRNYDRIFDELRGGSSRRSSDNRRKSTFNFDDCLFDDARDVRWHIRRLESILEDDNCEYITVADVATELGRTPRPIENKWGWKSTRNFMVEVTSDGYYILNVPQPRSID